MEENVLVALRTVGHAGVITIDNPPVNVLTDEVRDFIRARTIAAQADQDISVIIYTGKGDRAFMAGANIAGFPAMCGKMGAAYGYAESIYRVWDMIRDCPKPTIAAINGLALGAGMELALACDLRIAAEHATFGFPEIALGLFPGGGGTQRMALYTNLALTKEMVFTGKPIGCGRALASGFLNDVVPKGKALDRALELAETIAPHSQKALALAKQAMNAWKAPLEQTGILAEAKLWQDVFMTEDIKEGVDAFLNKRKPQFKDQ